ncbi:MAG TPA: CocE/NonD family hydrolase [Stellaceae bacterium]|nr:CocE/NonD family hydrolase [Stellaceae bacterium]
MSRIVETFPYEVECRDPYFIPLADGTRIAATLWLPKDAGPVPVVVEMVPYRRRDGTVFRDAVMHPYTAGHGIAVCRVDLRGSGDSDGILEDEYLPREQWDACEIIAYLARQEWCNGAVGMTGISWGGFNSLQVAARRPPALKAIITLCSTDDRYADDVHYFGGCYLTEDPMWSAFVLAMNAQAPDPQIVGARWREMWRQRLDANTCWSERWLAHQRRDEYWKQGSVCEDFGAIDIPVYAVCGWDDTYSNVTGRLLAGLKGPRKGLIGPWSHQYPCDAHPGPAIGYLQEALRWWRHWLKGEETGIMDEPMLRAWINEPDAPRPFFVEHPGSWVAEPNWPSPSIEQRVLYLNDRRLGTAAESGPALSSRSPATAGRDCGRFGGYGGDCPDLPLDQRREDGLALCFDTEPLAADIDILGAPVLELVAKSDVPRANVAVRLCDVAPDGTSTLITWGVLNLAHRNGHEDLDEVVPGETFRARIQLNDIGRRVAAGSRLRVALATQHWPIIWPQPTLATLTVEPGRSRLTLPVRPARAEDADLPDFARAEIAPRLPTRTEREGRHTRQMTEDAATGLQTIEAVTDYGRIELLDRNITTDSWSRDVFRIRPDDPLSARLDSEYFIGFVSGDAAVEVKSQLTLTGDAETFELDWRITASEGGTVVHEKADRKRIRRDFL